MKVRCVVVANTLLYLLSTYRGHIFPAVEALRRTCIFEVLFGWCRTRAHKSDDE